MARLTYILDTNVVADYIVDSKAVKTNFYQAILAQETIFLPSPVYYEVLRGLLKVNSKRKLEIFETKLVPQIIRLELQAQDWDLAGKLWADTTNLGKQLSDMDLLIAALTMRLDATLVTSDADFATLPLKLVNWRIP